MATIQGNQVKLNNGQVITPNQGGWYDGQQYWNGSLSAPGVINSQSDQIGAGQAVSKEVVQQTNPNNWQYIQDQRKAYDSLDQATGKPYVAPVKSAPVSGRIPAAQSSAAVGAGLNIPAVSQPSINLPSLYDSLYKNSGITDVEAKIAEINKNLNAKQQAYNTATNNLNDNPFLSEASRVGRNEKLKQSYESSIANDIAQLNSVKNDVATKKADIETKLNLELKQFDINSNQAQAALSQFNTLLSMGALDGASGEDIANITRQTGLSSTMIGNAIAAKNAKDNKVETVVQNYDDGKNQGFVIIDKNTGDIIARDVIAASKPKETEGGMTATQKRDYIGTARSILSSIDSGFQTVNGKLVAIADDYDKNPDKRLSLQEYQKAVEDLMAKSGLDFDTADNTLTQEMSNLGYTKWKW